MSPKKASLLLILNFMKPKSGLELTHKPTWAGRTAQLDKGNPHSSPPPAGFE
jgi:hypothetical protein